MSYSWADYHHHAGAAPLSSDVAYMTAGSSHDAFMSSEVSFATPRSSDQRFTGALANISSTGLLQPGISISNAAKHRPVDDIILNVAPARIYSVPSRFYDDVQRRRSLFPQFLTPNITYGLPYALLHHTSRQELFADSCM